ncbi:Cys-tRNA(Pro) deacylase [Caldalkalibacillus thermarum TA2.A1]|uniref:Cys-tRNA(Pro)/Cys-tRNA(Cys) deacylase n=1 Tax=Caldalkalibacillus thermarum (strain TA2.A1) TaxID=986075 RepID=A0A8X8L9P1_CALTT|nr:Cys-tRNA(Pro) deacylase [Caldalkalibacillus thermarum]QZT33243.1 Cys-tRNA(Pro) deacylase [Caldalkalibacillus thermarum TA2.A1]
MMKTNAMRLLEQHQVEYQILTFTYDETDLEAAQAAKEVGLPPSRVFKTLVLNGDKTGIVLASLPADCDLNLKALARASGNKKVELLPVKEIPKVTGYVREGVSPVGMKKNYPFYIDHRVTKEEKVAVSGGKRGVLMMLGSRDLIKITNAVLADLCHTDRTRS